MENRTTCDFCGTEISSEKLRKHIKTVHPNVFDNLYDLTIYILKKVESKTDEDIINILNDYKNNSVLYINDKYNFRFRKYITDLGLNHKSISESTLTKSCIEKRKNTSINKYGFDNPSKNENIKQKKRDTFTKNYGVDNIWKLREYRVWWESEMFKKHGKVCLADLYGNDNLWGWKEMLEDDKKERIKKSNDGFKIWYHNLNDEEKIQYSIDRCGNLGNNFYQSKLENRIEKILIENKINFETQKWISKYPYDFAFDNLILEVQGLYWHCDNRFYKGDDIIKRDGEQKLVQDIWQKDTLKKDIAEKYGYEIFYLYEYDMNKMTDEEVLTYIISNINENKENNKNKKQ